DQCSDVVRGYGGPRGKPADGSGLSPLDKLKGALDVPVVRGAFIADLRAGGVAAENRTRDGLLHATAFDRTPVLAASDGPVTLSPAMEASRRLLQDLFSQAFMQPVSAAGTPATLAPGSRINWAI